MVFFLARPPETGCGLFSMSVPNYIYAIRNVETVLCWAVGIVFSIRCAEDGLSEKLYI